jgi:hypothetical protein
MTEVHLDDHDHPHEHDHDHPHDHEHGHSHSLLPLIAEAIHLPGFTHSHEHTPLPADPAVVTTSWAFVPSNWRCWHLESLLCCRS